MTTISTMRAAMFALAAAAAMPAIAQVADTPPAPTGSDQLNAASSAYSAARDNNETAVRQAEESAEHRADREAYIAALVAHDRAVDRTNARNARQQMAYADAMAAWREQVAACRRGNNRACDAPTPRVADFY